MVTSSGKEQLAPRAFYAAGRSTARACERSVASSHLRDASERAVPLREIPRPLKEKSTPTLPVMATAGDVRELVRLLKKRASGITVVEAMNSEQKRLFDSRKIAAYEFWGIIRREGERLRLTPLGLELARGLEPEARLNRTILHNIASYRSALAWVYEQGLALITHLDVAAYWQEHYEDATHEHDEKMLEASVVCFFHLCQAAELGTMTIGKRGQPARLYVERRELAGYLRSADSQSSSPVEIFTGGRSSEDRASAMESESQPESESHAIESNAAAWKTEGLRLLISHTAKTELVNQLEVALDLADIRSAVVERKGGTAGTADAGPVAEPLLQAMRQCNAAVIVVTADDCSHDGSAAAACLREDVIVEIGAAFVFYERRVVLLWDERVPVPANLQNLNRCEFAGGSLNWEDAVRLLQAIKELKN
jgi:hypothetical protein